MCRKHLIQCALCYPDPREAFKYPQHICKCHKKFSAAAWSQSTPSKHYSDLRAVTWLWAIWSRFWKNPYRASFNRAIFFLCVVRTWFNVRCVTLILEKLLSTHNISVSAIKNFLRSLEISQLLQNTTQSRERWHDFETSEVDFGKILTGPVLTAPYFFYALYALDWTCTVFPWS